MAKRGEIFRKETKIRIISYLLDSRTASVSELSEALEVSRVTISDLMDELVDARIVHKASERSYSLLGEIAAVMLKLGISNAELVTVFFDCAEVKRTAMKLSPSMSYTDNAARLLGIAEKYSAELKAQGKKVCCALICREEINSRTLPSAFSLFSSDPLIASGVAEKCDGAVAYIDLADRFTCLSKNGTPILRGRCPDDPAGDLCSALEIFKPDRVLISGADASTRKVVAKALATKKTELLFFRKEELYPDERAALLALIEKRI